MPEPTDQSADQPSAGERFEPPYRVDVTHRVGDVLRDHQHLTDGEETDTTVVIAELTQPKTA